MASFGYGNKSDFTKIYKTPAPNRYEKPNLFDLALRKNRGKSFGVSRGQMGNNSWCKRDKSVGPG